MSVCVVLNADFTYLNTVSWRRAIKLILADKVRVVHQSDSIVRYGEQRSMRIPTVVALIKLIRMVYRGRVPFSKRNVIVRDDGCCAYCGRKSRNLSIDHINPRSRGGRTDFENCVAACLACNHRKGARTPNEANMVLRVRPVQPTIAEFMRKRLARSGVLAYLKEVGIF